MRICSTCGRMLYAAETACLRCAAGESWMFQTLRGLARLNPEPIRLEGSVVPNPGGRHDWTRADDDQFNCAYADWLDTEGPA